MKNHFNLSSSTACSAWVPCPGLVPTWWKRNWIQIILFIYILFGYIRYVLYNILMS